jgi:NADH:ubiquinone oxidoreductase subunit F (NADH-binding)
LAHENECGQSTCREGRKKHASSLKKMKNGARPTKTKIKTEQKFFKKTSTKKYHKNNQGKTYEEHICDKK